MAEDSVNVNKNLPVQVVDGVLAEKRGEWDALVAKTIAHVQCMKKLGEEMNETMWELCRLVGEVDTYFPYKESLQDFHNTFVKITKDTKSLTMAKLRRFRHMFYLFMYERDNRFRDLSFAHHHLACKCENPFQWLVKARENGWTAYELKREMSKILFVSTVLKRGRMEGIISKTLNAFVGNEAILGLFLSKQAQYMRERVQDEKLLRIIAEMEEWGLEKQKALAGINEEMTGGVR